MFQIENGRTRFWQWDINQRLVCDLEPGRELHFANSDCQTALVTTTYEENGVVYADVPNLLLQQTLTIRVWLYARGDGEGHTVLTESFSVSPRKPKRDCLAAQCVPGGLG